MAEESKSHWVKWLVSTVISVGAAGVGFVAWLKYAEEKRGHPHDSEITVVVPSQRAPTDPKTPPVRIPSMYEATSAVIAAWKNGENWQVGFQGTSMAATLVINFNTHALYHRYVVDLGVIDQEPLISAAKSPEFRDGEYRVPISSSGASISYSRTTSDGRLPEVTEKLNGFDVTFHSAIEARRLSQALIQAVRAAPK